MRSSSSSAASAKPGGGGFGWGGPLLALLALLLSACSTPPKAGIPARHYEGRARVACVGDSITAGAGLQDPRASAYPAVLAQLLGPAYHVRNFGVSGATLLKGGDHPYWNTPSFLESREFLPQVVIIALGTNDSKPQNWRHRASFESDLYALVRAYESLPSQPAVYLCTPPPVFQDRWGINAPTVDRHIAPTIRRIAAADRLPVIDLHRSLRPSADQFPDGIHPDAIGAANIAATVEAALRGR